MNLSFWRYPGGKGKLLPIILPYIDKILIDQNQFCDVFVGGGSVLLSIAAKYPNIKLFANDKNYGVSSLWKIVADANTSDLEVLLDLLDCNPSVAYFRDVQSLETSDNIFAAFRALFLNRCAFSGIESSGPIGGIEQLSKYTVDCRYNFKKIKSKILACHDLLAGRTVVTNYAFEDLDILTKTNIPTYCDPPYVDKGSQLYVKFMNHEEHVKLSEILLSRDHWVLSYDNHDLVRELYSNCQMFDVDGNYCINGIKPTWTKKTELIIIR